MCVYIKSLRFIWVSVMQKNGKKDKKKVGKEVLVYEIPTPKGEKKG